VLGPTLYDPAQSKNAAQIGFAELPCPSFNQTCLLSAPWGIYINPNVRQSEQDAAWQYIQFITSPAIQQRALTSTKNPAIATRPATLSYAIGHAKDLGAPVDFLSALRYGIQHIEVNAIPVTPAFAAVQAQLFVILSNMISGKTSPEQGVADLQAKMTSTLKRFKLG
jgi:ABC-type glycerol-3-phosphate transport system substrate-binding protein